jgi:hypothetical protein
MPGPETHFWQIRFATLTSRQRQTVFGAIRSEPPRLSFGFLRRLMQRPGRYCDYCVKGRFTANCVYSMYFYGQE